MATINAVLRKSKIKSDKTIPVYIRITEGTRNKYISIGWSVLEKDWDEKSGKVKKGNPHHEMINSLILKKQREADQMVLDARGVTDHEVLDVIREKKVRRSKSYFSKVAEDYLTDIEMTGKYSRYSAEKPRVRHFMEFLHNRDIKFREITVPLLKKFIVFLKTEKGVSDRTVMNSLVVLRTIYNLAITNKVADKNEYPFGKNGIRIKYPETIKIGLNEAEVHLLEEADLRNDPYGDHCRNVWLFSFYLAGMRISDVLRLRWSDIRDNRLTYEMGKNSKVVSLKLPDKAVAILEHYRKNKTENKGFVFPELGRAELADRRDVYRKITSANSNLNKKLKEIAELVGIHKKLTCHISRHTFGNITGDKISPQMLQKLYRHTDIKTTMGYQANFIHKDVDDALESVLDF